MAQSAHKTPDRYAFTTDELYDSVAEAIVAAHLNTRKIVYWNKGAEAMLGYASQDAVGKTLELICPEQTSIEHFFDRALLAIRQRGSWRTQWQLRRSDGTIFPVEVSTTTQQLEAELGAILVIREITRRKRLESESKSYARRQGAIAQLGQDALTGLPINALLERAVVLVAKCLEVDYCEVLELLPDSKDFLLRAGKGWKKGYVGEARVGAGTNSQAGYTLLTDEPVVVKDFSTETRFSSPPLLREHGVVSGITVIIQGRERPYGIIGAHTTKQKTFRRQDIDLVRSFANIIATAIERNRVEQALIQLNLSLNETVVERTKLIQLLQAVTVVANEAETVDNALAYTVNQICQFLSWPLGHAYEAVEGPGMKFASIRYWYIEDPERFASFREASESAIFEPGPGKVGQVLESRKVLWLEDLEDESFLRAKWAQASGLKVGLMLPVLVKNRVVAVLEFFGNEPVRFDQQLVEVMEKIGVQLGRVVERKEAEFKLRRRELLSTLGTAAAKVAHEISNPLNGMHTAIQLLERSTKVQQDEIVSSTIRDLKSEITRLRSLLQDFRSLSKPLKFDFEPCNLSELAQELLKIHGPQYSEKGIQVECDFPEHLAVVQADREKLMQVLLNLCQNAVDAMPNGGKLTIRGYEYWDNVCLEVQDTGVGIPDGVNIFEEFSTTKSGGTGLGLPIVQQIVSGHNGSLNYTSQRDRGTTFRLRLPVNGQI